MQLDTGLAYFSPSPAIGIQILVTQTCRRDHIFESLIFQRGKLCSHALYHIQGRFPVKRHLTQNKKLERYMFNERPIDELNLQQIAYFNSW